MILSRRSLIASAAALTAIPAASHAATAPFVVYDDALQNGWQSWSWAKVEMSVPIGTVKPIKVEGDPWSALALHHDAFSTAPYTKVTFFINGGLVGGQTLFVKAMADGKPVDSTASITLTAKTWLPASIAVKDINAVNTTIDGICFQGQADAYPAYYITKIQFE